MGFAPGRQATTDEWMSEWMGFSISTCKMRILDCVIPQGFSSSNPWKISDHYISDMSRRKNFSANLGTWYILFSLTLLGPQTKTRSMI